MGALKLRISVVTTLINVSKFADLPVCGRSKTSEIRSPWD